MPLRRAMTVKTVQRAQEITTVSAYVRKSAACVGTADFEAGGWEGRRRARLRKIAGILMYWAAQPAVHTALRRATQRVLP